MANKGIVWSRQALENRAKSLRGLKRTLEQREHFRQVALALHKTMSAESIAKRTETRKKNGWLKKPFAHRGERHWNWKGGISSLKGYNNQWSKIGKARRRGIKGKFSLSDWENLRVRYDFTCPCCKKREPEIQLTIDHIVPVSRGGRGSIENIQPLCRKCNSKKFTKVLSYSLV